MNERNLPKTLSWKLLYKTDDHKEFSHKNQQCYHWVTLLIQDVSPNK